MPLSGVSRFRLRSDDVCPRLWLVVWGRRAIRSPFPPRGNLDRPCSGSDAGNHLKRRSDKMRNIIPLQVRLSDVFLLGLFDTTMTNSNFKRYSNPRHHRAPPPPFLPPHLLERQRFPPNGATHVRRQSHRMNPYQIPVRQMPQYDSRIRHPVERPPNGNTPPISQRNNYQATFVKSAQFSHTPPPHLNRGPPAPKSSSSSNSPREIPPKQTSTPPCPSAQPKAPEESWKLQLCLEKKRLLLPQGSKPSALLFFTDDITIQTRESKSDPRILTKVYRPNELFGTAPPRKVHLREIPVTFSQIWNRHTFLQKWTRHGQDHEGYLQLEDKELKIQIQRHHVPGTLFTATEAGDFNINDHSTTPPDVCYRMVDAEGQEFCRLDSVYDLKRTVTAEDGQREVTLEGIDGKEITVEIAGTNKVRISGAGMPRNPEGGCRGDLILEVVPS